MNFHFLDMLIRIRGELSVIKNVVFGLDARGVVVEAVSSLGSFTSALQAFLAFNDHICMNGAACFGTTLPQSLGLQETDAGTFSGTCTYADGTTLGISIGPVYNGTQTPIAVGLKLHDSDGTEVARTDWNTCAKHGYDRNPHHHFLDSRKRQYLNSWPAIKNTVCQYFGDKDANFEGTSDVTAQA